MSKKRGPPPKPELSLAERKRRFEFVETMMLTGAPVSMIASLSKVEQKGKDGKPAPALNLTRDAVHRVMDEVRSAWREREEGLRANAKLEQAMRLQSHITKASANKSHGAVAQLERLLADLYGTLAPRRVEVDATLVQREALVAIVTGLDEAELDRLADEQLRLETDAARGRLVKELNGHANGKTNGST